MDMRQFSMKKAWPAVVVVAVFAAVVYGSQTDPNDGVILKRVVYKKVGGAELLLHVFEPKNRDFNTPAAAFVLFHGGGWYRGEPNGLYPHCRYFAKQGMVAISAQYRLSKDGNSPPVGAVEDAKSAVRYVRSHAASLGIDPNKIAAGGASAGGHLAVCTALFDKFDAVDEDQKISSKPNALVLISAAFDTTPKGFTARILRKLEQQIAWVRRPDANVLSPVEHVRKITAPCLVLHGTADDLVPFEGAERFCKLMTDAGNSCQLAALAGAGHGFSVYDPEGDNRQFERAMLTIDDFFCSLGYLKVKIEL
jgi:acetyl esterase/lipase